MTRTRQNKREEEEEQQQQEQRTKHKNDHREGKRRKTRAGSSIGGPNFRAPLRIGSDPHIAQRFSGDTCEWIRDCLTKKQQELFRKTCFGHLLDVDISAFSATLCHSIITREVNREAGTGRKELWYNIGGVDLKYGEWEFGLLTGLRFGNLRKWMKVTKNKKKKEEKEKGSFRAKYLSKFKSIENHQLKDFFTSHNWSKSDDNDAVKCALLFFVCYNVLDNTSDRKIKDWIMDLVDHPDTFNAFPWGALAWDETYKTFEKALTGRRKKMAEDNVAGIRKEPVHYQLCGFPTAFQAWILEIWPEARKYFTKRKGVLPRVLRWDIKVDKIPHTEITELVNDATAPEVTELVVESHEKKCAWYKDLVQYFKSKKDEGTDEEENDGTNEEEKEGEDEGEDDEEEEELHEEEDENDNDVHDVDDDAVNSDHDAADDDGDDDDLNNVDDFLFARRDVKNGKTKKVMKSKKVVTLEALDAKITELGNNLANEIGKLGDKLNRLEWDVEGLKDRVYGDQEIGGNDTFMFDDEHNNQEIPEDILNAANQSSVKNPQDKEGIHVQDEQEVEIDIGRENDKTKTVLRVQGENVQRGTDVGNSEINESVYVQQELQPQTEDKWRNLTVSNAGQGRSRGGNKVKSLTVTVTPSSDSDAQKGAPADAQKAALVDAQKAALADALDVLMHDLSNSAVDANNAPRYTEMIFEALSTTKDRNGCGLSAILHFIEQRQKVPQNFKKLLKARLKRLVSKGKLEQEQDFYRISGDGELGTTTSTSVQKDVQKHLSGLRKKLEEAAVEAASKVAEAENKSFVAAEAVKEAERVSKMAEDADAMLQLMTEIHEQCSRGEIIFLA